MDSHTLTDFEIRRHLAEIDARQLEMHRGAWQLRWQAVAAIGIAIGAAVALGIAVAPAFYAAIHTGHL